MGGSEQYTVDWADKAADLVNAARDDLPWYTQVAAELVRPGDRTAVDVGCGGGGMTVALATALGAPGRVLAVDATPQLLAAVQAEVAAQVPDGAEVDVVEADLDTGLAPVHAALGDGGADLVWASASVHHAGDQQEAVDAVARLLAGGGRLALAEGGLPLRTLPWDVGVGTPGLEVRLDAAHGRWYERMRAQLPNARPMPYGWPEALRRAGLTQVTTRTTLRERPTPLSDHDRGEVLNRLWHTVDKLRDTGLVADDDLAAWDRLLDPDDTAWLGHRSDLQRLDARSVHVGVRAE